MLPLALSGSAKKCDGWKLIGYGRLPKNLMVVWF